MTAEEIRRLGTEVDRAPLSASLAVSRLFDRFANAYVGPAAADVARHGIVDIGVGRSGVAGDERGGGHDLARLAVAALNDLAVEPSLLDFRARRRRADRFDGGDLGRADAVDRRDAGAGANAAEVPGAAPPQPKAAAELRAGHAEHVAQHPQQRRVAVDVDGLNGAVDLDFVRHESLRRGQQLSV